MPARPPDLPELLRSPHALAYSFYGEERLAQMRYVCIRGKY
jgi:hypothetical protein